MSVKCACGHTKVGHKKCLRNVCKTYELVKELLKAMRSCMLYGIFEQLFDQFLGSSLSFSLLLFSFSLVLMPLSTLLAFPKLQQILFFFLAQFPFSSGIVLMSLDTFGSMMGPLPFSFMRALCSFVACPLRSTRSLGSFWPPVQCCSLFRDTLLPVTVFFF